MKLSEADRLKDVSEYYFARKLEQIRQMRLKGHDVINLGIGSPDLAPSAETIAAAGAALKLEKNHGYAPYRSTPELRRAIVEWYQKTYGVKLDAETEVLPLLGSKEGIFYLSMAYLNPGDAVLVPNPGYPAYSSTAALAGARAIPYELSAETDWLPDLEKLDGADLARCKLMWINYPHMPTGKVADEAFFKKLVAFAKRKNLLLCHDNPYSFVLNPNAPLSLLRADPAKENSLELNSFSKSFNMAGWRLGMLLAAPDVVNAVLKVKSNVDSGMFLPLQEGAIAALKNSMAWHDERNSVYRKRRDFVWKIFDAVKFTYSKEQAGMFVWAKAPQRTHVEKFIDDVLDRAHVFITPGFIFGSSGKGYARASLCAPIERIAEALGRIEKVIS